MSNSNNLQRSDLIYLGKGNGHLVVFVDVADENLVREQLRSGFWWTVRVCIQAEAYQRWPPWCAVRLK